MKMASINRIISVLLGFVLPPAGPAAVLISSKGAWTGSGIVALSNGGAQTNSNVSGNFVSVGTNTYYSNNGSGNLTMQTAAGNVQPTYTDGYTYSYQVTGYAAIAGHSNTMNGILLANGADISETRISGPNNNGTYATDGSGAGTIAGSYAVSSGNTNIGQKIGLKISSGGTQTRFFNNGSTTIRAVLTDHGGINGSRLLYETRFNTNSSGLAATDAVLDMVLTGSGSYGGENGTNFYALHAGTNSADSCSIASAADTFRSRTSYAIFFTARRMTGGDPFQHQIAVTVGGFSTNVSVGTEYADFTLMVNADAAGIDGDAVSVGLTPLPTSTGINEYRFESVKLSAATTLNIERWYEDNNQDAAGGVPPDFVSRFATNNIMSWETSLQSMNVYYLRSSVYNSMLKTNAILKAQMAQVFNAYGIKVALDDTGATWAYYNNGYLTPSYLSSIKMIQDLKNYGWNICAVGLQSVLSKPLADGSLYDMSWRILDVVEYVRQVKPVFPQLEYGIIDALPAQKKEYKTNYLTLKSALEAAGFTLDFVDEDFPIDYAILDENRFAEMVEMDQFIRMTLGCKSGLFLVSARGGNTSDSLYRSDVISGLAHYLTSGARPDRITLASWHPYPAFSAPDEPDSVINTNGATMLGTFRLMDRTLRDYDVLPPSKGAASVSVDSTAPLAITSFLPAPVGSGFVIQWNALTGREYQILSTTNLLFPFVPLKSYMVYPQCSYTDDRVVTNATIFYKVQVVSP